MDVFFVTPHFLIDCQMVYVHDTKEVIINMEMQPLSIQSEIAQQQLKPKPNKPNCSHLLLAE